MTKEKTNDGTGNENTDDQENKKADLIAPDFDEDFNNWLEAAGVGTKKYTIHNYLHRFKDEKTTAYADTWHNYFPTMEEIGAKHGGGKFKLVCQVLVSGRKKKGTETTFYIDDRYNEIKRQNDEKNKSGGAGSGYISGPVSGGMNEAAQIVGLVQSLLTTAAAAKPATNETGTMARLMNTLLEDQLKSNFKLITNTRRQLMNSVFEEGNFSERGEPLQLPAGEPPNPLLETILGLVEQYAPQILGGGPAAEGIVKTVKGLIGTPALQPIFNDPAAMKKIVNAVNAKHGPDETRRLFGMIGFKL
jgi:hypothetical protein